MKRHQMGVVPGRCLTFEHHQPDQRYLRARTQPDVLTDMTLQDILPVDTYPMA